MSIFWSEYCLASMEWSQESIGHLDDHHNEVYRCFVNGVNDWTLLLVTAKHFLFLHLPCFAHFSKGTHGHVGSH